MPVNVSHCIGRHRVLPSEPLDMENSSHPMDIHPLGCAAPIHSLILPAIVEHLLYVLGGAHYGGWGG